MLEVNEPKPNFTATVYHLFFVVVFVLSGFATPPLWRSHGCTFPVVLALPITLYPLINTLLVSNTSVDNLFFPAYTISFLDLKYISQPVLFAFLFGRDILDLFICTNSIVPLPMIGSSLLPRPRCVMQNFLDGLTNS